tara:strand:+ start:16967 stop:17506 length:540 start_codon:yes stop_codon:yes gene_type:complete
MAEDSANEEDLEATDADGDEDFDDEGGPRKSKKKKIIMIALPVLLIAIGAGVFMSGMLGSGGDENVEEAVDERAKEETASVYYELPQMLVNLNSPGRRSNFLKIIVSLELTDADDIEKLESSMPRIVDNFQVYLRELRVEDLRGSAGIYRLREELLFRVNAAVRPARVTDVLFKEMLVQ